MSIALTADEPRVSPPHRFVELLPGLVLLFAIGFSGKLIEQTINGYGKAHHLALPNIEYVLWAIIFGLIIANTVGVSEVFRPGVDTYEFWLKAGIVLQGARFLFGDILKLGGVSLACVAIELAAHSCLARNLIQFTSERRRPANRLRHRPKSFIHSDRRRERNRLGQHLSRFTLSLLRTGVQWQK